MSGNIDEYTGLSEHKGYQDLFRLKDKFPDATCVNNHQCNKCMRQLKCPYKGGKK